MYIIIFHFLSIYILTFTKTKTTTYKQLIGDKLRLQNMLSMYRIYGLID